MTDVAVLAPGRCRLDPSATTVRFATRHLFGLARVRGSLPVLSGAVHVGDPIGASLVQVELDAAGLRTGNPRRDSVVRGAGYLDAARHPTLTFAAEGGDAATLDGTLSVRGVTRPVRLHITRAVPDGDTFVVEAVTRIDRTEFGLTAARGLVARHLDVTVHARAVRE